MATWFAFRADFITILNELKWWCLFSGFRLVELITPNSSDVEFQGDTWTTDGWKYLNTNRWFKRRDHQLTIGLRNSVLVNGKAYKVIYTQSTLHYKKSLLVISPRNIFNKLLKWAWFGFSAKTPLPHTSTISLYVAFVSWCVHGTDDQSCLSDLKTCVWKCVSCGKKGWEMSSRVLTICDEKEKKKWKLLHLG